MSEFVCEGLIEFVLCQLKIICAWIVDSILKSSVQDCSGRDDPSRGGVERTLKSKSDDFRRQTQPIKNGSIRVKHNRALSAAVAGIRIRGLSTHIASHRKEVVHRLDITVCGKGGYRNYTAR